MLQCISFMRQLTGQDLAQRRKQFHYIAVQQKKLQSKDRRFRKFNTKKVGNKSNT